MKKRIFYSELAYIVGLVLVAIGTAFMTLADFGLSMVAAPSYILHLGLSVRFPFLSFGVCDYLAQAVILLVMIIVLRRFRLSYFFSFVTAVLYGYILDGVLIPANMLPADSIVLRVVYFVAGLIFVPAGVAMLFRTYLAPGAHELFVKEVSGRFRLDTGKFKTVYDCVFCALSIALSFLFFGLWHFRGVSFGTVICALVNGTTIGIFTKVYDKLFDFKDRWALRKYFE